MGAGDANLGLRPHHHGDSLATALVEKRFTDTGLAAIKDKVLAGRRLSFEDGVALFKSHDLLAIGHLANVVRERMHGDAAYFVWNTHINHTNVCVATCDFCAFAAKKGEPRAYTMGLPEIFAGVAALPRAVREVHIVGGLHPDLPWSYFTDMMRGIKKARPDIHIKAFTAVEVFFFHKLYRMSVEKVLGELKEAGLDSMPGGGGRDLRQGHAGQDHPGQGRRRAVAGRDARGAPPGHPHERHHALRAHRVRGGPGGPPRPAARAARRDRRLRHLHSAGLPALGGAGDELPR